MIRVAAFFLASLFCASTLQAANFDYQLTPKQIAKDTYVFVGKREDFNFENGGNIVNTGFIVTEKGLVIIDSGPSRRYGEQMLTAIRTITDAPIFRVLITHHHPDHFLGNQVFDRDLIFALPGTRAALLRDAEPFTDNSYRMTGNWMKGTEPKLPQHSIETGELDTGDHQLKLIGLSGHTESDLAILDQTTGVLFAGDLAFYQRAATTPHAEIAHWQASLDQLESLDFKLLVPGHGPITSDAKPIQQTRAYLSWLEHTLRDSASSGLDMIETMQQTIPEQFETIDLVKTEYIRSVSHLFPTMENTVLQATIQPRKN